MAENNDKEYKNGEVAFQLSEKQKSRAKKIIAGVAGATAGLSAIYGIVATDEAEVSKTTSNEDLSYAETSTLSADSKTPDDILEEYLDMSSINEQEKEALEAESKTEEIQENIKDIYSQNGYEDESDFLADVSDTIKDAQDILNGNTSDKSEESVEDNEYSNIYSQNDKADSLCLLLDGIAHDALNLRGFGNDSFEQSFSYFKVQSFDNYALLELVTTIHESSFPNGVDQVITNEQALKIGKMFGYSQEEIKGDKVVIKPRDIEKLDLDTMCELEEILNDISASLQQGAVKG